MALDRNKKYSIGIVIVENIIMEIYSSLVLTTKKILRG